MSDKALNDSPNPYVFIVGCPRSGTSLLKMIMDAHPHLAIPDREQQWISKLVQRGKVDRYRPVTAELLAELAHERRFQGLLPDEKLVRTLENELPLPYARFVTRALDLHGVSKNKRLVGEKSPRHVHFMPLFHELWPRARFVHLIRDGRDVALSRRDWKPTKPPAGLASWADDPITTGAVVWNRDVRRGIEEGKRLGPSLYCEVRYEALVADLEAECRRLCQFLDIEFDDRMLRHHEGRERPDGRLSAKKSWRPVTSGMRDWRSQMSEYELEGFEAAAGELLEELGYERAVAEPSADALERAGRVHTLAKDWWRSPQAAQATARASEPW